MKRINLIKTVLIHILVLSALLNSGCKHKLENEDFFGEEYATAPEGFHVIGSFTANPVSVDFEIENASFNANFSHKVSWTITITGQSSGAVKSISGVSSDLNALNSIWDGGSDNGIFFRAGETCTAVITFLGSDISYTSNLSILNTKIYEGILVSDFDGNGNVASLSSWYDYWDGPPTEKLFYGLASDIGTVQGVNFLRFKGEDLDNDWFIGGGGYWQDFNLNSLLSAYSSNPDELYFNVFVNGNGNSTTSVAITLIESGTAPNRDAFNKVVPINWSGWKLLSFKLSDFTLVTSSGVENGILEVSKLKLMEIAPSPTAQGATSEINVDYIIFTKGPFKP